MIRSFPQRAPDPANLALPPLELADLFIDRDPIHEEVWSREVPQRIAQVLPALASLPQPLLLALHTHLSIAWYLGTKLTPKVGMSVLLRQRTPAGEVIWDGSKPMAPPEASRWQMREVALNRGDDLALVVSVARHALPDVERSIHAEASSPSCPECKVEMWRVYTTPSIQFRGSGFYSTDSK